MATQNARCPRCSSDAPVPDTFANGDTLPCGVCGSQLRVLKNDKGALRLVVADAGPLRDTVAFNKVQLEKLQSDLKSARHSFGIGANGFGIGVLYLVAKLAIEERLLDRGLIMEAVGVGVGVGLLLELANHFFLAKRKAITRLQSEIEQMRADQTLLLGLIREAERAQQSLASSSGASPRTARG